ncbi:MAG: bifunctional YncE family protein/alkaline phosphatase family protein [Thermohalobaculum sp.]
MRSAVHAALLGLLLGGGAAAGPAPAARLPSGFTITPLAAPGANFQRLATGLRADGSADANGAQRAALSPDGTMLAVLTSGYNGFFKTPGRTPITHPLPDPVTGRPSGKTTPLAEWIFLFDVRSGTPVLRQRLDLANTYHGLVWDPAGRRFYVSGGIDDRVVPYAAAPAGAGAPTASLHFGRDAPAIPLGHNGRGMAAEPTRDGGIFKGTPIGRDPARMAAIGGPTSALTAGLALSADGRTLAAVNMQSDSLSLIDTATRRVSREIRFFVPGQKQAVGELPYWVVVRSAPDGGFAAAYVTSQRDGQVLEVTAAAAPRVLALGGEPNRMALSADGARLYVANGDLDEIEEIDTTTFRLRRRLSLLRKPGDARGAGPDAVAVSADGATLFVALSNENAVAVLDLAQGRVRGRIPTGWFPSDVAVSADGGRLFVTNTKSVSGPNAFILQKRSDRVVASADGRNEYVLALEKAGLLTVPVPKDAALGGLSLQVDANNQVGLAAAADDPVMAFLRRHIRHVIYVMKENRTYDQVLGDLPRGNGYAPYAAFPRAVTPNNHALAERFALLDNFMTAGDVSGDGWNWSLQGHANVYTANTVAVDYGNAAFKLPFDWNGLPRNIGVALPDAAAGPRTAETVRITTLLDPTLRSAIQPGPKDVTADEGADDVSPEAQGGYIWDAALRAGLSVRHYGVYADENYYIAGSPAYMAITRTPFRDRVVQAVPVRPALLGRTDPYFRGWDLNVPDEWRYEEWKREFDQFVAGGNMPAFEMVLLMMDHFGDFKTNVAGLDTPERQMASNDHALGLLVDAVSHSRYWADTAIFVLEDDSQDGPDHVDSHRSVVHVISAYTRAGAVIHTAYNTTNVLRTIEDILGLKPLGLNDANAAPMRDVFTTTPDMRPYRARVAGILCRPPVDPLLVSDCRGATAPVAIAHAGAWWDERTRGMDFSRPDRVPSARFNALLREGLGH